MAFLAADSQSECRTVQACPCTNGRGAGPQERVENGARRAFLGKTLAARTPHAPFLAGCANTAGSTRPARLPVAYEDWDSGVALPSRLSCKSILFTV